MIELINDSSEISVVCCEFYSFSQNQNDLLQLDEVIDRFARVFLLE